MSLLKKTPKKEKKSDDSSSVGETEEEEAKLPRPMIFAGALVEEVDPETALSNLRRASI